MPIAYWIICVVKIIQEFVLTRRYKESYDRLQPQIQKKVEKALRLIEQDFRYPSLNTKKQKGVRGNIWEAKVDDYYRFLFELKKGGKCYLLEVGPHSIVET